ncbi:DUF7501 family protein [Haloarchaeobius sp. DYHT-AS-18]|uniref:DUF7501 family protein n=1 Tax=Haloarchaeobius sp. DYHT-AS-18 TaxID=3446117 RepID=UPI003EC12B92
MSLQFTQRDERVWDDPERCPFCGGPVSDGGAGFIDHVEHVPECAERFERWRSQVGDDVPGEWVG